MNCEVLDRNSASLWWGLRDKKGKWVSITAGWLGSDTVDVVLQLNDNGSEYDKMSLSVVSRSHLIEELIGAGAQRLNFIGGCNGLLERYCASENWVRTVIEKPSFASNAIRTIGRKITSRSVQPMPRRPRSIGALGQMDALESISEESALRNFDAQKARSGMTPQQKAEKVNAEIDKAVQAETEIRRQTDQRLLTRYYCLTKLAPRPPPE